MIKRFFEWLFGIEFVIVTIKDISVETKKLPSTFYGDKKDHYLKVRVPVKRLPDFELKPPASSSIVVTLAGKDYLFKINMAHYIYDIHTGKLLELIIVSEIFS